MSLEVLKTELEPPLACGLGSGFGELTNRWRLAIIRPNHDGRLHRDLTAAGVPHYQPWSRVTYLDLLGRYRTRPAPLFCGYAFVAVGLADIPPTRALLRLEAVPDQHGLVEELERLEQLRLRLAQVGSPVETDDFVGGEAVTIKGGQLAGLTGVVQEVRGRKRLIVQVRILNRGVSVELPTWRAVRAKA